MRCQLARARTQVSYRFGPPIPASAFIEAACAARNAHQGYTLSVAVQRLGADATTDGPARARGLCSCSPDLTVAGSGCICFFDTLNRYDPHRFDALRVQM